MANEIVKAVYGSPDSPLRIGNVEIPCYVLEDGKRVLVKSGLYSALNMSSGGSGKTTTTKGEDRLTKFLGTNALKSYVSKDLYNRTTNPIKFKIPSGGEAAGFEATILADICEVVLEARKEGTLNSQQKHIAAQCEILVRSFAKVGIIALVDEATGYQYIRTRQALAEILEMFISDEKLKWAKTFPDDFYANLFRLRGWRYHPISVKRPILVGKLTNDIVYERLAPGVLDELKKKNPKDVKGRRKSKFFQWLTDDIGNPKLREHIFAVTALMKAASTWADFKRMIQRALPPWKDLPLIEYSEKLAQEKQSKGKEPQEEQKQLPPASPDDINV